MFKLKYFLLALVILALDLFIYIILGIGLMAYEDTYTPSKGELDSWANMPDFNKTVVIGLNIWNIANVIAIFYIGYRIYKKLIQKNCRLMETTKVTTFDEYIGGFPLETRAHLIQIREAIKSAAPEAEESISYAMPAFKLKGKPLVYFAGYKGHIGFYATPTGHKEFEKDLSIYKQGKGSVQFPLDKPMPLDLITRITKFRVEESLKKTK